jgi:hypothetical protein
MKSQITNQEVLLFTHTSFAKRELCERDNAGRNETKNSADKLEKACWSGLLPEMLPDIFNWNDQKNMYVWEVNQANQFIHITLGSAPCSPDYVTSINPYFFHQGKVYN